MTYDDELILINENYVSKDDGSQLVNGEQETKILCSVKEVGSVEYYRAALVDFRPEKVFIIHSCEYGEQKKVSYKNERYTVIRTRASYGNAEEIELVCERRLYDV